MCIERMENQSKLNKKKIINKTRINIPLYMPSFMKSYVLFSYFYN